MFNIKCTTNFKELQSVKTRIAYTEITSKFGT